MLTSLVGKVTGTLGGSRVGPWRKNHILNKLGALQDVSFSILARRSWCPRKLQQNSRIVIDNVSAQSGNGAGFLVKGDAIISVPNSEHSNQTDRKLQQMCCASS